MAYRSVDAVCIEVPAAGSDLLPAERKGAGQAVDLDDILSPLRRFVAVLAERTSRHDDDSPVATRKP